MNIDRFIGEFDRALRAIAGVANAARVSPGEGKPEAELDEQEREHVVGLMRVNHVARCARRRSIRGRR